MTAHERHMEALFRTIFAGSGGGGSAPGPGPEPEPTPEIEEKDVTFYDWDGTPLYAYTAAEALALEELPAIPDRSADGLVDGEWNWTLAEIKTCVQACGICCVGANYRTAGNKTYIDVAPDDNTRTFKMTLYGGGTVDWGDGTSDTIASGTAQHTYVDNTPHTISFSTANFSFIIDPISAYMLRRIRGGWGSGQAVGGKTVDIYGHNLEAINLPPGGYTEKIQFAHNYYNPAPKLKFLAIPRASVLPWMVGLIGWGIPSGARVSYNYSIWASPTSAVCSTSMLNAFWHINPASEPDGDFFSLASGARVAKQSGLGLIADYYKVQGVNLRIIDNAKTIPARIGFSKITFGPSVSMVYINILAHIDAADIYIPSTLTYIRYLDSSYMPLWCARSIHCQSTTPPTIVGDNRNQKSARIYVPAEAVETYKAATGWAYYADYIYPETEEVDWS